MLDYINIAPIPPALRPFVRSTLCGESSPWPPSSGEDISLLEEHGVVPLLFARSAWPPLREGALRAATVEALRLADLREVLSALADSCRPLILKGTALAYSLYAAPELRPRSDTDLLVDHSAMDHVREIFTVLGFSSTPSGGDDFGMRQTSFWRTDSFGVDHTYDVHWDISNHAVFAESLHYDELRQRSIELPKVGASARGLSLVDALLLACIHRTAHHHGSQRLIWLYDIHLLRRAMKGADHERFLALATARKVSGVCLESIRASEEWFGTMEGSGEIEPRPDEPSRIYLDRTRRRGAFLFADLQALSTWRMRWRRLVDLALPPRTYMVHQFGTNNRLVMPLLYAFRAARGLSRLLRRVA